jgi:glycosyltransferase involved in cell wall biosynthesis
VSNAHSLADPELSLVVPCYNEAECVPATLPALCAAFARAELRLELVAVDNGSTDRTGEQLAALAARGLPVRVVRVEVNQGYGHGILAGMAEARAPWVGFLHADGQVDPEDAVRLFKELVPLGAHTLGKVCRRFRMDGPRRTVVTAVCNLLMRALWPGLGSIDVNASPKILHRDVLRRMRLESKRWFLDAEMLIKARHMRVRVLEMNAFARARYRGVSKVRGSTSWDFFRDLLRHRFSAHLAPWKRSLAADSSEARALSPSEGR